VQTMIAEIAGRLRPASRLSRVDAAALFNSNQNALIEAARAHGELLQWEAFTDGVNAIEDAGTRQVLTWLRDLFGLSLIEKNAAWYLIHGRISGQRAQAITSYIDDRLLPRLRGHALDLVAAFEFTAEHIGAPIALGAEKARQDEARDYYRAHRDAGTAPVDEKSLAKGKRA
jgi:acyl-CoA oxidase